MVVARQADLSGWLGATGRCASTGSVLVHRSGSTTITKIWDCSKADASMVHHLRVQVQVLWYAHIKPNSITLASSELVLNMFGASSELAPNTFRASSELVRSWFKAEIWPIIQLASSKLARASRFAVRYLGEYDAGDDALGHGAEDRLEHEQRDSARAAVGHGARPVADRVLRLDGEQQGRREPVDALDARATAVPALHRPPEQREQHPAQHERHQVHGDVVPAITRAAHRHNRRRTHGFIRAGYINLYISNAARCPYIRTFVRTYGRNGGRGQLSSE